jgi:predicted amidohydrolase YtcJ
MKGAGGRAASRCEPWWLRLSLIAALATVARPARGECALYHDGVVFTGASATPDARWFAVRDGRFAAVGAEAGVPRSFGACERSVDLRGRFVAPGLIDAHIHLVDGGLSLLQTDLSAVRTMAELEVALRPAAAVPVGGWIVARNLGLEPFGGSPPTHALVAPALRGTGVMPVFLALKGGHHVYVSRTGLERLGVDAAAARRSGGEVVVGPDGEPTGLLVDEQAWSALRKVYDELPAGLVARAAAAAQRRLLAYGVTAVQDNTFFPTHMAQLVRLEREGAWKLRVWSRSFGPEPMTRFLMRSMGVGFTGAPNPRVGYFGDKLFEDGALSSVVGDLAAGREPPLRYGVDEVADRLLFAGRYGVAFHVQSRKGVETLLEARERVGSRRDPAAVDVLDHCGSCGPELAARIRASGFKVTLLGSHLHDLPAMASAVGAARAAGLLRFRELFRGGVRPALTSDWPHGTEVTYPALAHDPLRVGLSPLAIIAVVVSGRAPDGTALPLAAERTVGLGEALLAYTANAAAVLGQSERLGRIAPGMTADFVVLPRSPFDLDPVELYRLDVAGTFVQGECVYDGTQGAQLSGAPEQAEIDERVGSTPWGSTWSPVIGYDPVPGMLLGGAYFFYPYEPRGAIGSVVVITAPQQLTVRTEAEITLRRAFGGVSPRAVASIDTWRAYYYGFGNDTAVEGAFLTRPVRLDAMAGAMVGVARDLDIGVLGRWAYVRDRTAGEIAAAAGGREGPVEGHGAAARLELVHDTRDNLFSTRYGGRRTAWAEAWPAQAGEPRLLERMGLTLSQFVPVWAPEVVLAMKAEGGASFGQHAYATAFALGGSDLLRGYFGNRFRGHHYAAATGELRFPIAWIVSGVVFGETGRVWTSDGVPNGRSVHVSGGGGLRFGLPPDGLIKLRFDCGVAPDQWGIFFKFNEAF